MIMGVARLGRLVARVPNSIVVGFTIGIAVVIALSQVEQVFGLKAKLDYGFIAKLQGHCRNTSMRSTSMRLQSRP